MIDKATIPPAAGAEPAARPFVKRYAFEPEPGQVGMGEDELRAIGEIGEAVTGGAAQALAVLMASLRARRESMGLSLTDVSERTGITRQAISKLENGHTRNPTLDTLFRYSLALDAMVSLGVKEVEAEFRHGSEAGGSEG